jgi:hypothetical protein
VREVRALLLAIPPLVADMIRHVIAPRLALSGIALVVIETSDPPPDLVIATEVAQLPDGIPAIVLSFDLAYILNGSVRIPLTPESLADKLLENI